MARGASTLYSLPVAALEVLDLTSQAEVDLIALRECIERDPALTVRVLRVVNSSLFGLSQPVDNLSQALTLLGTTPLKMVVLGFSLPDELFDDLSRDLLDRYWQQSLLKATAARALAETFWGTPGDEAFVAGLLDNVGMLVMLQQLGQPYHSLLERAWKEGESVVAQEHQSLGFSHIELTSQLLTEWKLPPTIAGPSSHRRVIEKLKLLSEPEARAAQVLHLADLLTDLLSLDRHEVFTELLTAARAYRGITESQLTTLIGTLQPQVDDLAEALAVRLPAGQDFGDVVAIAHRRVAELTYGVVPAAASYMKEHPQSDHLPPVGIDPEDTIWEETVALAQAVREIATRYDPSRPKVAPANGLGDASPETNDLASELADLDLQAANERTAAIATRPAVATQERTEFMTMLRRAVHACRQARSTLSLVLVSQESNESGATISGAQAARVAYAALDHAAFSVVPLDSHRLALVLANCERNTAVQIARALQDLVTADDALGTLSGGVATVSVPSKNFDPAHLVESADRCLYGSLVSGGNQIKSINVY